MAKTLLRKWKDIYFVRIHELAKIGMSNKGMAKTLGVSHMTFNYWLKRKPELLEIIQEARGNDAAQTRESFLDYVYKRLTPALQSLWDEITQVDKAKSGVAKIEALLLNHGQRVRQQLFVHALVACNFNASEACRKVNISKKTFENWCHSDPDFQDLIDEIHWHKKNFFEGALMKLVKKGDTSAVIFVNKAFNKDRGYSDKQEIDVKHQHIHAHAVVDIDSLKLPLEVRKQLLEAMENKDQEIIEVDSNEVQQIATNG